jgi:hypothetical protein
MVIEIRLIKDFKHNFGSQNTRLYFDLKTINGALRRFEKETKPDFDFIEVYQYHENFKYNEDYIIEKCLKKVLPAKYFN